MTTKIEWADGVLNCVTGCTKLSPGCDNCYALTQSRRLASMGSAHYLGATCEIGGKLRWTGCVQFWPEVLNAARLRKKPTRYFINSMSDTFHPAVKFIWIDEIFQTVLDCWWHEFVILTKRPEAILNYVTSFRHREAFIQTVNLILMTTMEDQERAILRIPALLKLREINSTVRLGLSCEPLLGPLEFLSIMDPESFYPRHRLNWIIAGGESGFRAREMKPAWIRSLRDQCVSHSWPFFFKQWGLWVPDRDGVMVRTRSKNSLPELDGRVWTQQPI